MRSNKRPTVSIVMPVYNAMPYLKQAVQSIFAQSITDWELIAVDDCSTDGSWEYLLSIKDPRVRLARNKKNQKQSYTQNRGVDMALGKYIARMDADDLSLPDRLEKQVKALDVDANIDVLGCDSFKTSQGLTLLHVVRYPVAHQEITRIASFDKRFFHGANYKITHGTMMGKAPWFKKWKADPRIKVAQDFDMVCRAQSYSCLANVQVPLYVYRSDGATTSWSKQTWAVYYKAKSLLLYGVGKGYNFTTMFGLMALMQRPFFVCVKRMIETSSGQTGIISRQVNADDAQLLQGSLNEIAKAKVPLN